MNSFTTSTQSSVAVATAKTGDYVVVWQSDMQDGSSFGIYARRYNAAGTAQGAEFKVNTYTLNSQDSPAIAMDAAGDFVVTWESSGQDGSNYGIYAKRFDAAGNAQGTEFRVNAYTTGRQETPSVAMDASGSFVIAWADASQEGSGVASGYGIYAQRYNAAGNAAGSVFHVNSYVTGDQFHPDVAADAAGDFVVVWESKGQDGSGYGIYAQRYNSAGTAQGGEFRLNAYLTGDQKLPSIAMDAVGEFVIGWQSNLQDSSGNGIIAKRFNSVGIPQGAEFKVNTFTTGNQSASSIAMNPVGDFTVTWDSNGQDGDGYGIFAQRYNAAGGVLGSEFLVNSYATGPQSYADVAMDSLGNFVVVWTSYGQDNNTGSIGGIDSQRFSTKAVAGPVGSETRVNNFTLGHQGTPAIALDKSGDYVIVWSGEGMGGDDDGIYAQRYNASGIPQGPQFRVNTHTADIQDSPRVAMDAAGNFVIVWESFSQDNGSSAGVYAQRYNAAGVAQGAEFRVNTYTIGDQMLPVVSMDSIGDFVISWESKNQDGSKIGIYAQRYSSTGAAQGAEFRVNSYTTDSQAFPSVAMDAFGDFVIAWESYGQDGDHLGVYAKRFSSTGTVIGSEFRVNSTTTSDQSSASVAMDSAGNFVIAWQSYPQDGSLAGVYAQRYNAAGVAQRGEFQVNSFTTGVQTAPYVAMNSSGLFVITWDSVGQDGSFDGIFAKRYDALGQPADAEFQVNTYTTGIEFAPCLAMDAAGDFVIAWDSADQDGSSEGIYAQRYRASLGPIVTSVMEEDGPRIVQTGDTLTSQLSHLTVTFSENLDSITGDPNSVTNPQNWRLLRNGVDVSNQMLGSITFGFNSTTNRYIARVFFTASLVEGAYQLVVRQTIRDTFNRSLDGEDDCIPGGDFRRNFAISATVPLGSETRVHSYTQSFIPFPAIAMDKSGDYVVAWSEHGLYAQRYNATGIALGGAFKVTADTNENQTNPGVAMDATGDFVITWVSLDQNDPNHVDVYARRFNSAGVAQGGPFRVNTYTTGNQQDSAVAMDFAGDFVITWQSDSQDGSKAGVFAQRYNAAGIAQGTEFLVNSYTTESQGDPSVAMNAVGDFVIAWDSFAEGVFRNVYAKRFSAAGIALGSEFRVNSYTTNDQSFPSVAMDSAGDFVIAWQSFMQDGSYAGVYAQRYNAAGVAQLGELSVNDFNTGRQDEPRAAMDASGDFVIVWLSYGQDGDREGIFAKRYDANGQALSDEFLVNTYTTGSEVSPNVAMDAAGDFVAVWTTSQAPTGGIAAQRYDADVSPWLFQIEPTTLSAAGPLSTFVTPLLAAFDSDSTTWSGATVQIANNYLSDQDVLGFANTSTPKITAYWDSSTGTLTLSGIDSVLNYRTALRNVTYHNTSANPNSILTRRIVFQATDGVLTGNVVSRDLTVMPSSIPAVLSGVSGTGTYVDSGAAIQIGGNLTIVDPDTTFLTSATVSFTNWQGEDRLNFNNIFALQHSFTQDLVTHTAIFTITGAASTDHYQTLLRSVVYSDVSANPVVSYRITKFRVSDGLSNSNVVTRNINVIAVNDPPRLSAIETTPLEFKANDPASPSQAISTNLMVGDPDSLNFTKAVIQISAGYQNNQTGHDLLTFVNNFGVSGSFDATTGTLTLTGTTSGGNYRSAIRSIKFSSSGTDVSTLPRTISIKVTDDFSPTAATSVAATRTVTVSIANVAPGLSGVSSTPLSYVRGAAAAQVASAAYLFDPDSINLSSATIQVTGNYQAGIDVLASTAVSGISQSFNAGTGKLTLSGISSLANFQLAIRSVTFKTSVSANTQVRTLTFILNDGLATSSSVTCQIVLT